MKGREVFDNIAEEACRELEAIVGPDYITTDPVHCQAYTGHGFGREVFWFQGVAQMPACVVIPENTGQVAMIVKLCNRYNIPYSPMSTHCIAGITLFHTDMLLIDLRRMDKLEIDGKNMYATVEPAVTYAQMQGEILKRDLCSVNPGGGGVASVLANHLLQGQGIFNWRITPVSLRRINGVEWVSPEGEVFRFGSLVEGEDGGYCQEGLGTNVMGMLKGVSSWMGGMGIVTKLTTKLYPFQPEELEPDGIGPNTCVKLPPRVRYYNITFPTLDAIEKAIDEIGKAQIGAAVNKVPSYWRGIAKARGDRDFRNTFWEVWNETTPEMVANTIILRVLLVGRASQSQLDYEEQVLMDIVSENGGTPRRTPQSDEATFQYANTPDMWMPTGMFGGTMIGHESSQCTRKSGTAFRDRLQEYPFKADFFDQKSELPWFCSWSLGRIGYAECHCFPDAQQIDPEDPEFQPEQTGRIVSWVMCEGPTIATKTGFHGLTEGILHPIRTYSPAHQNYDVWLDRLKQEFDPKGLSGVPNPFQGDMVLAGAPPEVITEEARGAVSKAEAGPWLGNPE